MDKNFALQSVAREFPAGEPDADRSIASYRLAPLR